MLGHMICKQKFFYDQVGSLENIVLFLFPDTKFVSDDRHTCDYLNVSYLEFEKLH